MLTQYVYDLANRFDHKKVTDQLYSTVSSTEGLLGLGAAALLVAGLSVYNSKIDRGCPQLPAHGFEGSTAEYRQEPQSFVEKWHKKLGPVFGGKLFGQYGVVINGTSAREVLVSDNFDFIEGIGKSFDTTLLTNSGPHKDYPITTLAEIIKKYLSPNLKNYTPRVVKHLEIGLQEYCGAVPSEGVVQPHVYPLAQHLISKASASVFVGPVLAQNPGLIDSFKNLVVDVGSELTPKPWLENFPTLVRARMWWMGKTSPTVKKHRTQLANALRPEVERRTAALATNDSNWDRPDDLLQNLIERYETTDRRTDIITYLINWLSLIIFAALHTTSENCTVAFYRFLDTPGLMEELLQEQNEVLAEAGYDSSVGPEVFTREILNKFVKMDSAIREAWRCRNDYIMLPHANVSGRTIVLSNGAVVLPDELVYISQWMIHNDPEIQGYNDLNEYKPLRYLNQDKNASKIGEDYLHFGLGKRACPGRWFAIQETKTLISMLLRTYKLEAEGPIIFPTQDRQPMPFGQFKMTPRQA
ncbi:cytochrome P450 [Gongronella butleri]|nr:cytochrome P450 [Gongronella butleri]